MNRIERLIFGDLVTESCLFDRRRWYYREHATLMLVRRKGKCSLMMRTVQMSFGIPFSAFYSFFDKADLDDLTRHLLDNASEITEWLEGVKPLLEVAGPK